MLDDRHEAPCREASEGAGRGLPALFGDASIERDEGESHAGLPMGASAATMERVGVEADHLHMPSHPVPLGVHPDMTEHGWERDDWPALRKRVLAADILVVGTPSWLGEEPGACRVLVERLHGMSGQLHERGHSVFHRRTAGRVVDGSEDGIKHAAMTPTHALGHLGYTILPQADRGWIGEAGPGPSYGDDDDGWGGRIGVDNDVTQRDTTIVTWNLMHMARPLSDGPPSHGNDRRVRAAGCRTGHGDAEHRA